MASSISKRDYVKIARKYCADVLTGKIPACLFVKQACQRQEDDLKRKWSKWKYRFDAEKAARVCKFIELLRHVKGPKAGERVVLEPWQCFILTTVFGWVDDKGLRRFQRVYIEVPRGNGKSTLCSGVALYMLCADGEKGADVYSFATTRDQARIVFDDAKAMARQCPDLQAAFGLTILNNSMIVIGTNSKFLPKSADASTNDGLNTHLAIVDELHAHKTRDLFDVVKTSIGKRSQPILWAITTAGFTLDGICMEERRLVQKMLSGTIDEPSRFGIIYTIDADDDWKTEEAAQKANPNWNVSVMPKAVLANLAEAMADPAAEKNYLTKHLDVWCNADTAFFQMDKWRKCYRPDVTLDDFEGQPCIYGIDLAAKVDIAAAVRLFWRIERDKLHYYVFPEFWLPSDRIQGARNSQYRGWARQDLIRTTDGPVIDLDHIEQYLLDDMKRFDVLACAFDPWQATQMAQTLASEGAPMIELRPTVQNFSEPMKELQALVYERRLHTDGNPVLEWMASNLVAHLDAKDNVYPRKEAPENKIDGIVALIMCVNQALAQNVEDNYGSAVETVSFSDLVF